MAAEEMITPPEKSTGAAVPVIHKPRVEQKRASSRSNKMDHTFTSTLLSGREILETISSASIGLNEPLTTEEQAARDELEEKRIAKPFPKVVGLLRCRGVPQYAIYDSRVEAKVEYATGNSDDDTILDFQDSGSRRKWCRLEPYFYKIETNIEGLRYRRRMKMEMPQDDGPYTNRDLAKLWVHEVDSDDDGDVKQETFHRPNTDVINDAGEVAGSLN